MFKSGTRKAPIVQTAMIRGRKRMNIIAMPTLQFGFPSGYIVFVYKLTVFDLLVLLGNNLRYSPILITPRRPPSIALTRHIIEVKKRKMRKRKKTTGTAKRILSALQRYNPIPSL